MTERPSLTSTLPVPFELPQLLALRKAARDLIDASVSPNTLDVYTRALRQLGQWLDGEPVSDETLAAYLVHLHEQGKAPAIQAVMSDGLLRISEARALAVDDVTYEEDGTGRLLIRTSKTDQEGEGAVLFLAPPSVERIRKWLEAARIQDTGPLFRRVYPGGDIVGEGKMNVDSLREVIKQRCEAIGTDPKEVSGHSLRIGGAQSLAAAGASLVELQNARRWISPAMPGHYTKSQLADRGVVARIKYNQDQSEP